MITALLSRLIRAALVWKWTMLKIGDFSKLGQVSVKTLHYYDQIGLLKPVKIDPFTSYRYYSIDQLPRLNRILALKDLGFSLDQIGVLLDEDLPAAQIRGMLRMRQADIHLQMEQMQTRLLNVEARLRQIEKENTMSIYDVVIKKIEPQKVVAIRDVVPSFEEQDSLWRELAMFLKKFNARASGPSLTIYYDSEYREQDVDLETATPVASSPPGNQRVSVREIPGVEKMACVIHHGPYETIGDGYAALINWIEGNGYRIIGPNREVYLRCSDNGYEDSELIGYADYVALDPQDFVTEIQFPVEKAKPPKP